MGIHVVITRNNYFNNIDACTITQREMIAAAIKLDDVVLYTLYVLFNIACIIIE